MTSLLGQRRVSGLRQNGCIEGLAAAVALCLLAWPEIAHGQTAWHSEMVHSGSGYWHERLAVSVCNTHDTDPSPAGYPVPITVQSSGLDLAGHSAESLRAVESSGQERLFVLVRGNQIVINGPIGEGDILIIPAGALAPADCETVYVYTDNPDAFEVDEFLGHFTNGGFETVDPMDPNRPEGWVAQSADALHTAEYLETGGRTQPRCVAHQVGPGAERTWIQWQQSHLPVVPAAHYTVTGWVRHSGVDSDGVAGFYVHTYTAEGRMRVNLVQGYPGDSEGDWRPATLEFDSDPLDAALTIGTVMYTSGGQAYFDDVTLDVSPHQQVLVPTVTDIERRDLSPRLGEDQWDPLVGDEYLVRTDLRVRSFEETPAVGSLVVVADLRRAHHLLRRLVEDVAPALSVVAVDPTSQSPVDVFLLADDLVVVQVTPEPGYEHRYFLYLAPAPAAPVDFTDYGLLVNDPGLNLVANPDIDADVDPIPGWQMDDLGSSEVQLGSDTNGVVGPLSLRMNVSPSAPAGWPGFRQFDLPVVPGTRYLYAVAMRTDIDQHVAYGHFNRPKGFLSFNTSSRPASRSFQIYSNQVRSPSDCVDAEIHLTMFSPTVHGTAWYDGILLAPVVQAEVVAVEARPDLQPEGLVVWPVNPMIKVFPDDLPPIVALAQVDLAAARNEQESFLLALRSDLDLEVTAEALPLVHSSSATLDPPQVFRVDTVPVDAPSAYYLSEVSGYLRPTLSGQVVTDGWAGPWPDPLVPSPPGSPATQLTFALPANHTQALWFRLDVPGDALPGLYTSGVRITSSQGTETHPVSLRVWDFVLPSYMRLQVVYTLGGEIWSLTGGDLDRMRDYYRFMGAYHISPGVVFPEPVFTLDGEGILQMDATGYEQVAQTLFDELGLSAGFTPYLFYAFGWAYRPHRLFDAEFGTDRWDQLFTSAYGQFVDLLDRHGWKDRFGYYISDEPFCDHPDHAEQVAADLAHVSGLAQYVDPDLPVYSSTWRHCRNLDGVVTHWGVAQYGGFSVPDMEERLAAGDKLWFTTDGQQAIDTPYLATERLLPTYCYRYGVSGYEFWGFSWWTHNPWTHAWHRFISQSDQGERYYQVRYPDGDGYVAYPGWYVGHDLLVPSIRLEALREGIEDYEYYRLLEDWIEATPDRDHQEATEALEEARSLVTIPNAGGMRSLSILPDPDEVYRVRQRVGTAIEALASQPSPEFEEPVVEEIVEPAEEILDGVDADAPTDLPPDFQEETIPDADEALDISPGDMEPSGEPARIEEEGCGCAAGHDAPGGQPPWFLLLAVPWLRRHKARSLE